MNRVAAAYTGDAQTILHALRESKQTADAFTNLLQSNAASSPESKRLLLNRSLLAAPLNRPPQDHERLVTVTPLADWPDGFTVLSHPSDEAIVLSNNEILTDAGAGFYRFPSGAIVRDHLICFQDRLFVDDVQFFHPGWPLGHEGDSFYRNLPFQSFSSADRSCYVAVPENHIDLDVFVFSVKLGSNVAHMVADFLSQLSIYDEVRRAYPDIRCYIPITFRYDFQRFLFEKVFHSEMAQGRIISEFSPGVYRNIFVASPQFPPGSSKIGFASIRHLRARLRSIGDALSHSHDARHSRIFVSRRDATSDAYDRSRTDHAALESHFTGLGFGSVVSSELSPSQQIATFHQASIVAGLHGAGLISVLFSKDDRPTLIEVDAQTPTWRMLERFIKSAGINHILVEPDRASGTPDYSRALRSIAIPTVSEAP